MSNSERMKFQFTQCSYNVHGFSYKRPPAPGSTLAHIQSPTCLGSTAVAMQVPKLQQTTILQQDAVPPLIKIYATASYGGRGLPTEKDRQGVR